jgi:hypothetical protein
VVRDHHVDECLVERIRLFELGGVASHSHLVSLHAEIARFDARIEVGAQLRQARSIA